MRDFRAGIKDCHRTFCCCSGECILWKFRFLSEVNGYEARMLVHLKEGKLRQYYRNYKDYEFIPGEDTAMPKSITRYMDKSLKIATTPQTCYTWFNCDEDFLNNEKKQMQYLTHTLPFFLDNLNK